MFQFFSKKRANTSLDWVGVDMHSHILPGIDDGAPNLTASMRFVKRLSNLGFEKLICTPHIFREVYPADSGLIMAAKDALKQLIALDLNVTIDAAAEYMLCPDFNTLMKQANLLCLPGKHILVGMSYQVETSDVDEFIFNLRTRGYNPVLAHPEQYVYYHSDYGRYRHLKNLGCLMQLNLLSLTGYYGKEIKGIANRLIKDEMIDLVGTDLHHDRHLEIISNFANTGDAWRALGKYPMRNRELFL